MKTKDKKSNRRVNGERVIFNKIQILVHRMCLNKDYYITYNSLYLDTFLIKNYFTIRGGSLKKIAKKIIPNVPTNKNV